MPRPSPSCLPRPPYCNLRTDPCNCCLDWWLSISAVTRGEERVEVGPRQPGGPFAVEVEGLQLGVDRRHWSSLSVSLPSRDGAEASRVMTAFQWGDKPLIRLNAPGCASRCLGLRRTVLKGVRPSIPFLVSSSCQLVGITPVML